MFFFSLCYLICLTRFAIFYQIADDPCTVRVYCAGCLFIVPYLYVKRWQHSRIIHPVLSALPAQSKTIVECNFFSFYRKSWFAPSPKIENEYIDFHINKQTQSQREVLLFSVTNCNEHNLFA